MIFNETLVSYFYAKLNAPKMFFYNRKIKHPRNLIFLRYMKFYNFLLNCESATFRQKRNALDTPKIMCLVLSKLPGTIREKWKRNVMSIRRRHSREPDFPDLIQLVDDEATLANYPLFSKEALHGYVGKKEASNRGK